MADRVEALAGALPGFLLESMADGFSVLNEHGEHLLVNRAFCEMTGFSREELLRCGPPPYPYWPEDARADIQSAFDAMTRGREVHAELVFCRKDGARFPVMVHPASGEVDGRRLYFANVQDLTAVKAGEEREAELRRLVETLVRGGDLATWDYRLDEEGGSTVSDSYFTLLGYEPGAWRPGYEEWAERVHPDDIGRADRSMQALIAGEARLYDVEHRMQDASEGWRWVMARGYVTARGEDGRPSRITGTLQDIHRLKTQEEKLRQFEKMEVLGQLTGGIAHDFNNILTTLAGNLELLSMTATDAQRELLDELNEGVERAEGLVQSLLYYARRKTRGLAALELAPFFRRIAKVLEAALPERITLQLEPPAEDLQVIAEPGALESALLNLVLNARDAIGGGTGTVKVHAVARRVHAEEASRFDVEPGAHIAIVVEDDGCGMSREVLERALEPLYTTKQAGTGTGLGLSMAHRAVRDAGGFVVIDSEEGRGTTICLVLPRPSGAMAGEAASEPSPTDSIVGDERVLLVDDEAGLLKATAAGLRALGYEVEVSADPRRALVELRSGRFDALITDIVMPYTIDGVELAARARQLHPRLPVVLITGYASEEREAEARALGRVLWKPFRVERLARELRGALAAQSSNRS